MAQRVSKKEAEVFLPDKKQQPSSHSKTCHSRWWNQGFHHQKDICRFIESYYFQALIIFLVVVDTALVVTEIILDSFKVQYECDNRVPHAAKHHNEMMIKRLEFAMEITHYACIAILLFFFVELWVKIYAFGKEFWNIHRKKMEYLDAFIVITSLIIDLIFLSGEEKILGHKLILILAFRLWRFVRIISSVSEAIREGQTKHRKFLNTQYLTSIQRLFELLKHKTSYIENDNQDLNVILEHFRMIDAQCQSSLDALNENHELPSSAVHTQFIKELEKLESKNEKSAISALFQRSPEV